MEMHANVRECPQVAADESPSYRLATRILKLRWMGMETEAERMQVVLSRVDPACTLLAGPFDTD